MKFDVIVVGAGHAGLEAATAAARVGASVGLFTLKADNVGQMSCNPSIGGVGKGTIVKELEAFDGFMPKVSDVASINYMILNRSKGPAVWGWRAQMDRKIYSTEARRMLKEEYQSIQVIEDEVTELIVNNSTICGVIALSKGHFSAKAVIITTGTFLGGTMFIGLSQSSGGRIDESASFGLSGCLKKIGFDLQRLKTGTPPRILKSSINFNAIEVQELDPDPMFFSIFTKGINNKQVPCYITHTNVATQAILSSGLDRSPIYQGLIKSSGPRYCVSIEDKIRRFPGREGHLVFLEPEGLDSDLVYPNGISTSMPKDIQEEFVRSINGLENAILSQYGYAVEYDYIDPIALYPTLETKLIKGLFFAGQINGTTGYEEAAGQGLVAGINAAGKKLILSRFDSYIGVMIDDLTTVGVGGEPYRMFTSRAERRLSIRGDNAISRLYKIANEVGAIRQFNVKEFEKRLQDVKSLKTALMQIKMTPHELAKIGIMVGSNGIVRSAFELLGGDITLEQLICSFHNLKQACQGLNKEVLLEVKSDAMYEMYLKRHNTEIEKEKVLAMAPLDVSLDYAKIAGLSREEVEKLNKHKPTNIGSLRGIPGITPAGIFAVIRATVK